MKKICLSLVFFLLALTVKAQYGFDIGRDDQTGQTVFQGRCSFDDLNDEASFDWMTMNANQYNPDPATVEALKKALPSCELIIFMGTWCDDTHNLLPKLYKTMLLSRCFTNYKMYGVNRDKKSNKGEEAPYHIVNVPAIIVLKDGKELGRVVESPRETIEKDLLKIVAAVPAK
jgi:hypothetical protein